MNLKEMRAMAKSQGIRGYSKMKKADLEGLIKQYNPNAFEVQVEPTNEPVAEPVAEPTETNEPVEKSSQNLERLTNRGLKNIAKERGLKNWSKLNKKQLIDLLS